MKKKNIIWSIPLAFFLLSKESIARTCNTNVPFIVKNLTDTSFPILQLYNSNCSPPYAFSETEQNVNAHQTIIFHVPKTSPECSNWALSTGPGEFEYPFGIDENIMQFQIEIKEEPAGIYFEATPVVCQLKH